MTDIFENKLSRHKERDQKQAKNLEAYDRMVKAFSHAEEQGDLQMLSMMYILDLSYERSDICLALHTVEMARGWH
jgi:hypothetical protein